MVIVRVILVVLLLIMITGCSGKLDYLNIDYVIDVLEDGSETATIRLGVPKSQAEYVIDKLKSELGKQGYWVENVNDNNNNSTLVLEGKRKQALGTWILPYKPEMVKGDPLFNPTYKDYFFFRTYSLDLVYDFDRKALAEQLKDVRNVTMSYTVNMPGSMLATNAHAIQGANNRWVVDINRDNEVVLSAKSRIFYPWRIAGAIGIVLLPAAFVIRKKYKLKRQPK